MHNPPIKNGKLTPNNPPIIPPSNGVRPCDKAESDPLIPSAIPCFSFCTDELKSAVRLAIDNP